MLKHTRKIFQLNKFSSRILFIIILPVIGKFPLIYYCNAKLFKVWYLCCSQERNVTIDSSMDIGQQNQLISISDLLKGPLPQDNIELISIIRDKFVNKPPSSDVEYNLKLVSTFESLQHINQQIHLKDSPLLSELFSVKKY